MASRMYEGHFGNSLCPGLFAYVKAGVTEHEVAIAATNAMVCEIANSFPFVELMDTWTWFQSGINTDGAHNPVTNRKVQSDDILGFSKAKAI